MPTEAGFGGAARFTVDGVRAGAAGGRPSARAVHLRSCRHRRRPASARTYTDRTLLRDPCEHAISNYCTLLNDYRLPDARAAAWRLGFSRFFLTYPYFTIFQTASLHVGIRETPLTRTEDLIDRLPILFDYRDEMHAVGTPRVAATLFRRLAAERSIGDPKLYPHRTRTRLLPSRRETLHGQYADLQRHPTLGPLIAAEQALCQKALERVAACGLIP